MERRLVTLACLSFAVAAWPTGDAADEISPAELTILAAAALTIVAVQSAALWAAARVASDTVLDILTAALVAANAYHFALLTVEASTSLRWGLSALVGLAAWGLLKAAAPSRRILLFASVFTVLSLGHYAYGRAWSEPGAAIATEGALPLKSTRNVYLISTESLHSPYAFRRLYGIENAPHVAYLKEQQFRILDRAYAADTSTRLVYQRVMEFKKPLKQKGTLARVFKSGNTTFSTFHKAGYRVQFIYISNYMNLNHALVEHAFPATGFYICDNLRPNFFYFVCRPAVRAALNRLLFGTEGQVSVADEIAHIEKRIAVAAADDKPWLTISHIAFPGHSDKAHRYDDAAAVEAFRAERRALMPRIAENYRRVVSAIRSRDPDAVIVTFGDHGMWLTRGMDAAASNDLFSADDYIEDRYGVLVGVYPADFCRNRIFEGSTTTTLVESIVDCLNGDDSPTPEEAARSRTIAYRGDIVSLDALARSDARIGSAPEP